MSETMQERKNTSTDTCASYDSIWHKLRSHAEFCIRIAADATGGAYSIVEIVSGPGDSTFLQQHEREDMHIIVLEGMARVALNGRLHDIRTGGSVFLQRGTPHAWGNPSDSPMRLLIVVIPGGWEESLRIESKGGNIDFVTIAEQFHISILGPKLFG